MNEQRIEKELAAAATFIMEADALIIGAGAGMGVDSGLPDFRGKNGFWRAYPALGKRNIRFEEIATPEAFQRRAYTAWGFYGHRLLLYRRTTPHAGFAILREFGAKMKYGAFVFTSNVDGQFQKAGFPSTRIHECHGSIHQLQCPTPCSRQTWSAEGLAPEIDEQRCMMTSPLPQCPHCGAPARPNALLFNDYEWVEGEYERSAEWFRLWRSQAQRPVVIELGAGRAITTVRNFCERQNAPLIRINPREPWVIGKRSASLPFGALDGLHRIRALLSARGFLPPDIMPHDE